MNNLELHMFSNSTVNAPDIQLLIDTYKSFSQVFNVNLVPTIWIDSNPNITAADEFIENVTNRFVDSTIHRTESLADGYIKSIKGSTSDYMFMLEHDWVFCNNIKHSLDEIIQLMEIDNIIHFRFNKRANEKRGHDKCLLEKTSLVNGKQTSYCVTKLLSNNPHIINRKLYLDTAFQYISNDTGTRGIEHNLIFNNRSDINIWGAIYGNKGYKQTIRHLDGREKQ